MKKNITDERKEYGAECVETLPTEISGYSVSINFVRGTKYIIFCPTVLFHKGED